MEQRRMCVLRTIESLVRKENYNFLQNFQERDQLEEARDHGRMHSFSEGTGKKPSPCCPFERTKPRYQNG